MQGGLITISLQKLLIISVLICFTYCTSQLVNNDTDGLINFKSGEDQLCKISLAQDHAQMGFVIENISNLRYVSSDEIQLIRSKLLENGVVVIKNQTLTREDQVVLSSKLGKIIVLPPSFEGNDPEAGYPEIQRVTNYFQNGTWKGKTHCFGCYWHKDGNFQENGYLFSLLYADQAAENRSSTQFLDNCEVVDKLSKPTIRTLLETVFTVSVRDVPDFKKAREEEYLMYPHKKRHDGIYRHPENGRKCAYVTADLITDAGFSPHLRQVFEEVTQKSRKYRHFWQKGDVVIWDNLAVMHRAGTRGGGSGPADRTPRMLYRTQSWL